MQKASIVSKMRHGRGILLARRDLYWEMINRALETIVRRSIVRKQRQIDKEYREYDAQHDAGHGTGCSFLDSRCIAVMPYARGRIHLAIHKLAEVSKECCNTTIP